MIKKWQKSDNRNVSKGTKPHMKETVMSEDGKSQRGLLSSFSVTSFQFNLDLGFFFFFLLSVCLCLSAARIDLCKYLESFARAPCKCSSFSCVAMSGRDHRN